MAEVSKIVPQALDPDKEYVIRVRSINGLGNASDWSEGLYVDTAQDNFSEGYLKFGNNNFSILNDNGEIVFGAFSVQEERTNLVKNPSFETNTNFWTAKSNSTLTRVASQSRYGQYSGRIKPVTSSQEDIGIESPVSGYIDVAPYQVVSVSTFVYREFIAFEHQGANVDKTEFILSVNFYDDLDQLVGIVNTSRPFEVANNDWVRLTYGNITIPTGVRKIGLSIQYKPGQNVPLTINEAFFVDGFLVELDEEIKEYFDGGTLHGVTSWLGTPHASESLFDNTDANSLNIQGTIIAQSGYIGSIEAGWVINEDKITSTNGAITLDSDAEKIYIGEGNYSDPDTSFYADALGRFSLKDELTFDGTTLSISGPGGSGNVTYAQPTMPPSANDGDIWIDTDDNNTLYRWDNSLATPGWVNVQAVGTQTYYQGTAPGSPNVGDIWVDDGSISGDEDVMYRWNGATWVVVNDSVPSGGAADDVNNGVTTISGGKITTGTLDGNRINASSSVIVGTGSYKVKLIGGAGTATYMGITSNAGNPSYNSSNTPLYVGADQRVSIGNKLTYDGSNLSINGGGTFSGNLSAAGGTFSGALSSASGTFTGALSGGTINIGGGNFVVNNLGQVTVSNSLTVDGSATVSGSIIFEPDGLSNQFTIRDPDDPSSDWMKVRVDNNIVEQTFQIDGYWGLISFGQNQGLSTADGFYIGGTNGDTAWIIPGTGIRMPDGTPGSPTINFLNDTDTGIYRDNTNSIAFAAAGVDSGFVRSNAAAFIGAYIQTTAGDSDLRVASNGVLRRIVSAKKYKTDIRKIDRDRRIKFIENAEGVMYRSLCENDKGTEHVGLIADDVYPHWPELVITDDETGEIESLRYERITAILLEEVKELRQRLSKLENKE